MAAGDYVKQEGVPDFRSAWDEMDESTELADSYGLGQRDSMQEAVEAVIAILGMQVVVSACLSWAAGAGSCRMLCSALEAAAHCNRELLCNAKIACLVSLCNSWCGVDKLQPLGCSELQPIACLDICVIMLQYKCQATATSGCNYWSK